MPVTAIQPPSHRNPAAGRPEAPAIEISGLQFAYQRQKVLSGIDLRVEKGDFVAVIGPNGGGKTTLIKLILGLLAPTSGTIRVNGKPPGCGGAVIGYVPQHVNHNQHFPVTAVDVVLMGKHDSRRRFHLHNRRAHREQAMAALAKMGVADCAGKKIAELSGGQRQRVLIARALVTDPELLVLDEPTASIDTKGQSEFYRLLSELNRELTIVVVSHDLLVISSFVKSIACVNTRLHYHQVVGSTSELVNAYYSCSVEEVCPVETVVKSINKSSFLDLPRHD